MIAQESLAAALNVPLDGQAFYDIRRHHHAPMRRSFAIWYWSFILGRDAFATGHIAQAIWRVPLLARLRNQGLRQPEDASRRRALVT